MSTEGLKYVEILEEKKDRILWFQIIYIISKSNPIVPVLFFLGVGFILLGIIMW